MKSKEHIVHTDNLKKYIPNLKIGDRVLLSGNVFTSRDAAHKRILALIDEEKELPYPIKNSVIYYTGSTPAPKGLPIGSCGPTTSSRMDIFTPTLYDMGLTATIGKGPRNSDVVKAIMRNNGVYLCAIGGAGALAAKSVLSCNVIAFYDLGCESVKHLVIKDFPLVVGIDSFGGNIFEK